ncbi:hypothetical protein AB0H57_07135 [Micromonospora sp. NPDC050686]|uniref:hypothetical protein n=1 Tax=Micromonospora sp. NPDC050686 TaxID=3154631 RepID=UPI0033D3BFA1
MPLTPPARRAVPRLAVCALLAAVPLAGCGAPPALRDAGRPATAPTPALAPDGATGWPTASPGYGTGLPPGGGASFPPPADGTGLPPFGGATGLPRTGDGLPPYGSGMTTGPALPGGTGPAVPPPPPAPVVTPCPGRPTGGAVISLLRGSARVLSRDVAVRVTLGPLCADGWQYTTLDVTGHEELQAITRDGADGLTLVTTGTDVCSPRVSADAPPGIRALACDADPPAAPGA